VQARIVKALQDAGGELSLPELVQQVQSNSTTAVEVKAAVLPLISGEQVELTSNRRLRLREE
jgi:hypothetical protein